MSKTYWLSFVDSESICQGVVILDAPNESAAIQSAWDKGLNPGGEVMAIEMATAEGMAEAERIGRNRLIPAAELMGMGYRVLSEDDEVERERVIRESKLPVSFVDAEDNGAQS